MRPPRVSLRRPIKPSNMVAVIVRTAANPAGDSAGIADRIKPSFPPGMSAIPIPMRRPPPKVRTRSRAEGVCRRMVP